MQRAIVPGLTLVFFAMVTTAHFLVRQANFRRAATAATTAVGAGAPIPQDAAAIEKRRRDRLEWNRRTLQGAYDRVGKRNARWDEPARKTMELAARMFSGEVDPEVTLNDVYASASAAVHAGCDDPMLLDLYSRSSVGPNHPGMLEAVRRTRVSARALAASQYPAVRRAFALQVRGHQALSVGAPGDEVRKEAERDFDAALALLGESVASDEHNEFWEAIWLDILREVTRGYRTLGVAAEAAYDRVDAGLSRVADAKVLRLLFRGIFWLNYGWEARTTAFAPAVPAGGFDALEKRLAVARTAFEQAWQLRPGNGVAARYLMDIDRSIGGDRATMELWFDRAMKANGDDRAACFTKLDWLDPKWHGSAEEMLAFGRACRDTKNWRTGITLLVADAHWRIAGELGPEQGKYMNLPEVWADIQPVYDEYLKHHPNDDVARSKFATFCFVGGHYREAQVQYETLGDRLTEWSEFPYVPLEEMKRNRKRNEELVMNGRTPIGWPGWHFIGGRNNDGHWRVNIPVEAVGKRGPGILGARVRNVWTCTADGIMYMLRIQPVPPALRNEGPERVLDAARAETGREHRGEPHDLRDVKLANRPAQEYRIDAPDLHSRIIRVRTAVIGRRLYELSVTGSETGVASKAADEFLNSFTFREQSGPSATAGQPRK